MTHGFRPHSYQKRRTWYPFPALAGTPAFLTSAASTDSPQSTMLGSAASTPEKKREEQKTRWSAASSAQNPEGSLAFKQQAWDKPLLDITVADLLGRQPDPTNQARLNPISATHAGDWLLALPITSCGFRLDDETVNVASGLRLGVPLCGPHGCPCGAPVAGHRRRSSRVILPPRARPPTKTRSPERLGLQELDPGRLSNFQRANRSRKDRRKETIRPLARRKKPCLGRHSGSFLLLNHLSNSLGGGGEGKVEKYSELSTTHFFTPLAL